MKLFWEQSELESNFTLNDNGGSAAQSLFNFDIVPSVFPVPIDSSRPVMCLITMDVTFFNTDQQKKRMLVTHKRIIQQNEISDRYELRFNVDDINKKTIISSANNIVPVNVLIILFAFIFFFI